MLSDAVGLLGFLFADDVEVDEAAAAKPCARPTPPCSTPPSRRSGAARVVDPGDRGGAQGRPRRGPRAQAAPGVRPGAGRGQRPHGLAAAVRVDGAARPRAHARPAGRRPGAHRAAARRMTWPVPARTSRTPARRRPGRPGPGSSRRRGGRGPRAAARAATSRAGRALGTAAGHPAARRPPALPARHAGAGLGLVAAAAGPAAARRRLHGGRRRGGPARPRDRGRRRTSRSSTSPTRSPCW